MNLRRVVILNYFHWLLLKLLFRPNTVVSECPSTIPVQISVINNPNSRDGLIKSKDDAGGEKRHHGHICDFAELKKRTETLNIRKQIRFNDKKAYRNCAIVDLFFPLGLITDFRSVLFLIWFSWFCFSTSRTQIQLMDFLFF